MGRMKVFRISELNSKNISLICVILYETIVYLIFELIKGILISNPMESSDRKSTRLNSSHGYISYAVFCLKKKKTTDNLDSRSGEAVMDLLRELHLAGATICMVSLDPRYARHADRSLHLLDGRVLDERLEV